MYALHKMRAQKRSVPTHFTKN